MGVPITTIKRNQKVKITSIELENSIKRKLWALGIYPSVELSIIYRQASGAVVVATDGFKLALDSFIAKRLIVTLKI
jgi:Fe2+ transport system protein FeoA